MNTQEAIKKANEILSEYTYGELYQLAFDRLVDELVETE